MSSTPVAARGRLRPGRRALATLFAVPLALGGAFALATGQASAAGGAPNAYVLQGSAAAVIDTGTRASIGSVAVPPTATDMTFSPDGATGYLSTTAADVVTVIDTATNVTVGTITTGDGPSSLGVSPAGDRLYVMLAAGNVQVLDPATGVELALIAVGATGDLAVSADGARAYVAAGLVYALNLTTNTVTGSFSLGEGVGAGRIVLSPDGTRGYVTASAIFDGTVVVADLSTNTVIAAPGFGSLPGQIAISPDGARVYVGVQATFVDTGYGAGFFPGRTVRILDTATNSWAGQIDLGAAGSNWSQQNTASGIAVTPNRSAVYIGVPRIGSVAIADFNTNVVSSTLAVASPGVIAIAPDPNAITVPYVVNAVDDSAQSTTLGGLAVPNVLANDRFGGIVARLSHVSLTRLSSTDPAITLSAAGAVDVAPGGAVGTHTLSYRICEISSPLNCDDADVTIGLRDSYVIDAVADIATSLAARQVIANVLINDTLNAVTATTATVRLTQVASTSATIQLNPNNGSVFVYAGTPGGSYTLRYRICEIASPVNCDETDVAITVLPNVLDAVDDAGTVTRSGGTAVANVLANDSYGGVVATTAKVTLAQTSSTSASVALNTTTGAVTVAAATPIGTYSVGYRMCETLVASNCDAATVTVRVNPYLIDAVNDSGRGSSKYANTIVANVLANDRLAGLVATTGTVKLTQVSSTNRYLKLQPTTGAVVVTQRTSSGIFTLVYKICEKANLTNCDTATVTADLSGGL